MPSTSGMNDYLIGTSEAFYTQAADVPYEELSEPERVFKSVWELESQVNNGGFDQYFFNASGDLAPFAANALRTIGAPAMAAVVDAAVAIFRPDLMLSDRDERQSALSSLSHEAEEQLQALDQRFFGYPDDLTSLLYQFVAEHRQEIRGST